jgi:PAS domain S-box-containing protein
MPRRARSLDAAPRSRRRSPAPTSPDAGSNGLTDDERYALIAEHSSDLIALLDTHAHFVYASPSFDTVLGYRPAELIGTSIAALIYPDDLPMIEALWPRLLAEGTLRATYRHRHADGSWRWIEARGNQVRRGDATYVVKVARDVTERRRAEDALRESEAQLRLALDAARMGTWEWDIRSGALSWSPQIEILHGFEPGTFDSNFDTFMAVVEPDDREPLVQAIEQAVAERSPFSAEFRIRWPNGEIRWMFGLGQAFYDRGIATRMIGVGLDISERKQAQEALRQSEERYRAFIGQSSEGIWRFELEQPLDPTLPEDEQIDLFYQHAYLAECNDATARMYGFAEAGELVGARLGDFLVRSDPRNTEYLRDFIRSGYRLTDAESVEVDRDGAERFFLNNLLGILEGGLLVRAWGSQRDITDRKQIEAERARLYGKAQEAVRLRDIFFSVAAHELKTPLTSLLGQAQLLQRRGQREGTLNERDLRTIGVVADQAARLNKMVAALLDISRIEQGRLSIEQAPLDLVALTQRVVDEIRPTLTDHTLTCTAPADPLRIEGDALRLEQVLQNLIGNAVKYSPAGGPVEVRLERQPALRGIEQRERVRVAVRDQGIGIPQTALPQLFQRFYRATNADDRQFAGLGIGLYVVKEIVELHGGTIAVESKEGRGSTFTFWLPLNLDDKQ